MTWQALSISPCFGEQSVCHLLQLHAQLRGLILSRHGDLLLL